MKITIYGGYLSTVLSYDSWACKVSGSRVPKSLWQGQAFFTEPEKKDTYGHGIAVVNLFHESIELLKKEYGKDLSSEKRSVTFKRRRTDPTSWVILMTVKEYE